MATLFIGLVAGSLGAGYFIYGKKQSSAVFMLCGAALCFYPYMLSGLVWLLVIGAGLLALPFFINR